MCSYHAKATPTGTPPPKTKTAIKTRNTPPEDKNIIWKCGWKLFTCPRPVDECQTGCWNSTWKGKREWWPLRTQQKKHTKHSWLAAPNQIMQGRQNLTNFAAMIFCQDLSRGRVNREVQTVNWEDSKEGGCRDRRREGAENQNHFPPPTPKSADFTFWTWVRKKSPY